MIMSDKKKNKNKKPKPSFKSPNVGNKKRVKDRWRKPRGTDNKKRVRNSQCGASPKVGYKNAESVRGMHPLGLKEILVSNVIELMDSVDQFKEGLAVRISGSVGKRKKEEIRKKCEELKIRVLN
ncbi:50S ribosomal protein L32e [Candidatus Micrarchaeota archaeon]|nr:50S ribosomal protein L32e [Candidatus Micrarchaeota archaeon]